MNPQHDQQTIADESANRPVRYRGLITAIDYEASVALTQSEGHCVAKAHGLHTVLRGEHYCRDCGAR